MWSTTHTAVMVALVVQFRAVICSYIDSVHSSLDTQEGNLEFGEFSCASFRNTRTREHYHMPSRCQIWDTRLFCALPRHGEDAAITLGLTSIEENNKNAPSWAPYPSWTLQEEGNCNAIQNAVDILVDNEDRLWVLDGGNLNPAMSQPISYHCPPKILIIDLSTNQTVDKIDLSRLVSPRSRLQYLTVDYFQRNQIHAYISDAATRSVLVWDLHGNRGWRVVLPRTVLTGCRDMLYLALIPRPRGSSILYFTYLSSDRMFSVSTEFLMRRSSSKRRVIDHGRKPARIILLGTDGGATIFFRFLGSVQVYVWDTLTIFKPDNFVLVNPGRHNRFTFHIFPDFERSMMMTLELNLNGKSSHGVSHSVGPLLKWMKNEA